MGMRSAVWVLLLRLWHLHDRVRLRVLCWLHPGLEIHPSASRALAVARFHLAPGATLRIGADVATEREPRALHFDVGPGARVEVGAGTWLCVKLGPTQLVAFEGARLEVGENAFLNGCHLSAKRRVRLGRGAMVGPGSRVFDADQHDLDDTRPERCAPVEIGDFAWVASDVTVLRGVRIGEHSVVGARAVVTRDVPPHTLALGAPAEVRGRVGDRSRCR